MLGVYAERDNRVNATMAEARAALEKAGVPHRIEVFPGADHAFFNDTGPRYDERAAKEAFAAVLGWFARHLA